MTGQRTLRIGTRGSQLARWQANWTAELLRARGVAVDVIEITTQGDIESRPLAVAGGQGLFTRAIQQALLEEQVDLAVHSLKDLPTEPVEGLCLTAVPEREQAGDLLITSEPSDLESLPIGAKVGTGSLRRKAQLLHARPDLQIAEIRGNLDTRLRKLTDGQYDAIILAAAGVRRLGWDHVQAWPIPFEVMCPAVGQGALGWEIRSEDSWTAEALAPLDHLETRIAVLAERALLRELRAGCLAPVGAHAHLVKGSLHLHAVVLDPEGVERLDHRLCWADVTLNTEMAEAAGVEVARALRIEGASNMIDPSRRDSSLDQ